MNSVIRAIWLLCLLLGIVNLLQVDGPAETILDAIVCVGSGLMVISD